MVEECYDYDFRVLELWVHGLGINDYDNVWDSRMLLEELEE